MAYFRCGGGADTSIVTAGAADVLSPKVIVDADGNPLTGTMPNNGAVSPSALNCGGSYTIPKGYHNGSGKVTANSLASQTSADAVAGNILTGKTAWVSGSKITGTMTNRGAVSQALDAGGSYTIPAGYHNGSGKVTANSLASQTNADAVAGNILTGKTAWVNGSKVTGTMTNNGAVSQTLSEGDSYTIPAGYHNGSGKVTARVTSKSGTFTLPAFTEETSSWKTFLTIADVPSYPTEILIKPSSTSGYGIREAYIKNTQQTEFTNIGYISMLFEYSGNYNIAHAYFDSLYDICRSYNYKPSSYYTEFQSIYDSTAKTVTIQCRNTHSSMYLVVENSETWRYTLYGSFS